jgi:hypothetical protein
MAIEKQTVFNHPIARSEGLLVETIGDESVIYDTETKVAHALKPLAAAVYMYADGKTSAAEIAELASYRLATEVTEPDVVTAFEELRANSLLEAPVLDVGTGVSRRTALKTFAAAGAGSMLVMSVATSAAQACITCSTVPPSSWSCSQNGINGQGPYSGGNQSDCRICDSNGPCGSAAACCCAPCDGSASNCCQPICLHTVGGKCPSGTLPLSVWVGGESGHPKIACPTGYGAFQGDGYQVKCCKANAGPYCSCVDSAGTCGSRNSHGTCVPY